MQSSRHLVTTDWLAEHLAEVTVLDCRVRLAPAPDDAGYQINSAAEDFAASHIPGAQHADLLKLSDPDSPLPFMMPPAQTLASALGALGVDKNRKVVIYDGLAHMWAGRLWWMLDAIGHPDVAVLNGGWAKWTAEGRAVTDATEAPKPGSLEAELRTGAMVDLQTVADVSRTGSALLLNALDPEQFRGEGGVHMGRRGRIPGSANVPGFSLIGDDGAFLPEAELRAKFEAAGALGDRPVVSYCNAGILAASNAFVLRLLGKQDVAVYDGGLVDWVSDPSRPLEQG